MGEGPETRAVDIGYDMSVRFTDGRKVDYDKPAGRGGYLRRAIGNQSGLREALEETGLGYWPSNPPTFPRPEDWAVLADVKDVEMYHLIDIRRHGLEAVREMTERWVSVPPAPAPVLREPTPEEADAIDELLARNQYVLSYSEGLPGIALHKLCSNDGWHVTRDECRSGLSEYERRGRPEHDGLYGDVVGFIRLAAEHDGFEVF